MTREDFKKHAMALYEFCEYPAVRYKILFDLLDTPYDDPMLTELRKELNHIKNERVTQRKKRNDTGAIRVALVGYTNAGKSTMMNCMLEKFTQDTRFSEEKKVFEKDMLFATLDTTVRKIAPPGHIPFLLSDTVGFISKLPHNLIEAFHSTLEEAVESDLLLQAFLKADVVFIFFREQLATVVE